LIEERHNVSRFLILQLRPETEASDNEYEAILEKGGLHAEETHRIRLDRQALPDAIDVTDYSGVIVGGGPGCVSDAAETKSEMDARIEAGVLSLMPQITETDTPFLGCCYGIGILAHHLGAEVSKARYGEAVGPTRGVVTDAGQGDPLLQGLGSEFDILVGHKEAVQTLPEGCVHLMTSQDCPYQMIRYRQNVYATQFHPEADASVFETRIRVYKDYGYFPVHEAEALLARIKASKPDIAPKILGNFVERYRD
jgi:GMP synthase (glutamine-hydrolysing)